MPRKHAKSTQGYGPPGVRRFPKPAQTLKVLAKKLRTTTPLNDYRSSKQVADIVNQRGQMVQYADGTVYKMYPLVDLMEQLPRYCFSWLQELPTKRLVAKRLEQFIPTKGIICVGRKLVTDRVTLDFTKNGKKGGQWIVVQPLNALDKINQLHSEFQSAFPHFLPELRKLERLTWSRDACKSINNVVRQFARDWKPHNSDSEAVLQLVRSAVLNVEPNARVQLYGSRFYNVCTDASDIDIAVETLEDRSVVLTRVARALRGVFDKVVHLSNARAPIVMFEGVVDGHRVKGDVSVSGEMGQAKSKLIKAYIMQDPRVRPFLVLLKAWSTGRQIASSETINWFSLMMMAVAFLIQERIVLPLQLVATSKVNCGWHRLREIHRDPELIADMYHAPVCLETGNDLPAFAVDGCRTYFYNKRGWRSRAPLSPIVLLHRMFKFYGTQLDPQIHAVSARLGAPQLPRNSLKINAPSSFDPQNNKKWPRGLLIIEDPFETQVNCARNAPIEWVEALLWEMRRAAWAISRNGPFSGPYSVIDRLALRPSRDVFCDAGVWAPTSELLKEFIGANGVAVVQDEAHAEKLLRRNENADLEVFGKFQIP
ncbi:hypothetical protein GGI25_004195 [Coemansia spiralis]|uniref:polynucleotide adenylyltransferase n=2 Tax=Coemansia TaxID=4863 RepID=A0A9W8G4K7_9FUNG|nr:hypothetical protein BX070DRAFT_221028 [Coemansia spiralis]KAJ1990227.1 hypothetical protein EDC05_004174 [Coemansia umbellata]KAJ2624997.1 hypothetical protein GGI26_001109 [Coemansia sp. RSA 1358]KAJ2674808.1 hypothetical protein GGI25_004195 [Coemansia spiralis]